MLTDGMRIPLSIGFVTTRRKRLTTVVVLGVVLVVLGCCVGTLISIFATNVVIPSQADNTGLQIGISLLLTVLLAMFPVLSFAWIARCAAWLDGTRLTVRGLRTRSVDLRGARSVRLDSVLERGSRGALRSPTLTVVGAEGKVSLRLRNRDGALIPSDEMLALAGALSTAACPGAAEAVSWLRAMAADPRSLLM